MATSPIASARSLLLWLIQVVFYGSLLAGQVAVARGTPLSAGEAFQKGIRRIPGMIGAGLLFGLALVGGFVLLIIPGIYLWGRLELWAAAMFEDDAGAIDSLRSSWNLTKGRWWRTVTAIGVAGVIAYILIILLASVPMVAMFMSNHASLVNAQLAAQPASFFSNFVIVPVLTAVVIAVHHDCKLRSEGGDLAERAANLNSA